MNYTTVTKLARNGKKEFEGSMFKTVLYNNEDIGMVLNKEMADALQNSGILDQIREELWELNDKETVDTVSKCRNGNYSDSISLEDFRKKYDV